MINKPKDSPPAGRDASGRWLPGTTGNPFGRPRKLSISQDNPFIFAQTLVNIKVNGEVKKMTRRQVIRLKAFEAATQGDMRAIVHLQKEFAAADTLRAEAQMALKDIINKYILNETGHQEMPREVEELFGHLQEYLYFDPDYLGRKVKVRKGSEWQ